eukprot:5549591-Amphidinium_carterae.1
MPDSVRHSVKHCDSDHHLPCDGCDLILPFPLDTLTPQGRLCNGKLDMLSAGAMQMHNKHVQKSNGLGLFYRVAALHLPSMQWMGTMLEVLLLRPAK